MLLLLVLPSVDAACSKTAQGWIAAPSGTANPPAFSTPSTTHTITTYYVFDISHGNYELESVAPVSRVCHLGTCSSFPDFNVAWMVKGGSFDTSAFTDSQDGDSSGVAPAIAQYALVYMRYGPDFGTADGTPAARFTLRMGC